MMEEVDQDLVVLYPKVYFSVLPMIQKHCDRMEEKHGEMYVPRKEELDELMDNILDEIRPDDDNIMREDFADEITRQRPVRRDLRDLLRIIFIDELRGRRRRRRRRPYLPYGGRPDYYGGYPQYPEYPGYPPYPGY
jgi:hypothetical protein